MDNFLGTLVFLLPGVMAYFWLQSFGINPVMKHSPTEFTALSALLWLPVSVITLCIYNMGIKLSMYLVGARPIWSINDLKIVSGNLLFLIIFLLLSSVVSFCICAFWAKWGYVLQQEVINKIRVWRGVAPFSNTPSVWDEIFTKNDAQVVEIGKIDKPGCEMIGCINKVSRPLEPERNLYLNEVDFFTDLVEKYKIPVTGIFYDTKSGTYVKIFDPEAIRKAQERPEETTSSGS